MINCIFILILSIQLTYSQGIDSQFATPSKMTDSQASQSKTFVHEGKRNDVIEKGCSNSSLCTGEDSGMPIESMIGKAYALLGVMTSGGGMMPKLTKKPVAGSQVAGSKEKPASTQMNDYCMLPVMGYELVATSLQSTLQTQGTSSTGAITDPQLQSLVSAKASHKARKNTASFQSGIYGAATLCYAAMATWGGALLDWKFYAKAGGAAALTTLYIKKAKKHDDAAKKVQLVIDSLPKAGDCNPWTGTSCFCKEASSKSLYPFEYEEVCVLNKGDPNGTKVATGCSVIVNNAVQTDLNCQCKKNNTCFRANLPRFGTQFSTATNLMNGSNANFEMLNSGVFDQAQVEAAALNAASIGAKMIPKLDPKVPSKVKLSEEQKKMAEELSKVMPPGLAQIAAASPSAGAPGSSSGSAPISDTGSVKPQESAAIKKAAYQDGGGSFEGVTQEPDFTMPSLNQSETAAVNGSEVVSFSEEALSNADVTKAKDTPIFDIITNRYRRSGWTRLDGEQR